MCVATVIFIAARSCSSTSQLVAVFSLRAAANGLTLDKRPSSDSLLGRALAQAAEQHSRVIVAVAVVILTPPLPPPLPPPHPFQAAQVSNVRISVIGSLEPTITNPHHHA